MDPVEVGFRGGWQTKTGVSAEDVEKVRQRAGNAFRAVFAASSKTRAAIPSSMSPAPTCCGSRPPCWIWTSPRQHHARPDANRTFNVSASNMTLRAELRDSQSGALLARAVDQRMGRETGDLRVMSQSSNVNKVRRAWSYGPACCAISPKNAPPPPAN